MWRYKEDKYMKKWINHPCIIEDDNGKLSLKLFKYFYCEFSLPKFEKDFKDTYGENSPMAMSDWESLQDNMAVSASSNERNNGRYIESLKNSLNKKMSFFQKLYNWWNKIDPVEETFNKVKNAKGHIEGELSKAIENIDKLILRAEKSNQHALIDKLKETKYIIASEIILSQNGYDTYVTEDKIIEFFKKCNKGVRIDYIRNYSTLIPFTVLEKKEALDKLGVFDNYVVMHYDPNMVVFKETNQDKKAHNKVKDPILFGLIKGSRKLYFVDDWITDDDDLTLDELNIVVENASSRLANFKVEVNESHEALMNSLQEITNNMQIVNND